MSEWRNETVPLRAHQPSPPPRGPTGPRDWSGASVTSNRLVAANPFALSACPLFLTRSRQPFASIHHRILWLLSPSPPLYQESPSPRSRQGCRDNDTEPIRRKLACASAIGPCARFLINISIRYFEGIYDARRHMSRMLVSAVEATKFLILRDLFRNHFSCIWQLML